MTAALEVDCVKVLQTVLFQSVTDPVTDTVARIVTETPASLADVVPVVQVIRIGGPDDGRVLDIPTVALHGFVLAPNQGNRLLATAVATLRASIGRVVTVDGSPAVMTRLRVLSGPSYAATENQALRHRVALIQPRIKIAR